MKNLISKRQMNQIDALCKRYNITEYSINADGSIDAKQHIDLDSFPIIEIPINFRNVYGGFYCCDLPLTSLKGAPIYVQGDFHCSNTKISSLVGGPKIVDGNFSCNRSNVTNLTGIPRKIGKDFSMVGNHSLLSTYSGEIDLEVNGKIIMFMNYNLPNLVQENQSHIRTILRYQRHFEIWNGDLTLNIDNFNILLDEINDGLE